MVTEINESEFDEKMKGKCVVDFHTTWCGPCKLLAPIFAEVAGETKGVSFYKIDLDKNDEIARDFDVVSVPTIILFEDGKPVKRASGFMKKEKLKEFIEG